MTSSYEESSLNELSTRLMEAWCVVVYQEQHQQPKQATRSCRTKRLTGLSFYVRVPRLDPQVIATHMGLIAVSGQVASRLGSRCEDL